MTFKADVYKVLIASPSDVGDERVIIPEVILEWNASNTDSLKTILLPVKWETNTFPSLGGRPQRIINEQIVKDCDILVGVFWTRIGTDTGKAESGTVEEIEQFVATGKPVMLYFSQSPVDPDRIEIEQFQAVRAFRDKMRLEGLTESYSGITDFRQKFSRQLSFNVNSVMQVPAVTGKTVGRTGAGPALPTAGESAPKVKVGDAEKYVLDAISKTAHPTGWSNISSVGKYLATYTPVNYKALGFDTLTKYLKSIKTLEVKQEQRSPRSIGLDTASVRVRV